MRRKDREQDRDFALSVIHSCEYATLAMINDDNTPYCIPVSPVLIGDTVYFHSAVAGKKCDNIKANKNVCMSFVSDTELVPERFSTKYKSAVVLGLCTLVEDHAEKTDVLFAIAKKYAPEHIEKAPNEIEKSINKTLVYKIEPIEITGKAHL